MVQGEVRKRGRVSAFVPETLGKLKEREGFRERKKLCFRVRVDFRAGFFAGFYAY
jgi:hypothetical protein